VEIYRITAVLKVETDIITSNSFLARPSKLTIDVVVFICDVIKCLTSDWLIIFSIRVSLLNANCSLVSKYYPAPDIGGKIFLHKDSNYIIVIYIIILDWYQIVLASCGSFSLDMFITVKFTVPR